MRGMIYSSERERRSAVERECHAYVTQGSEMWERMPEVQVIKMIRSWVRDAGIISDVRIVVSPTTERRYHLVPEWAFAVWLRNNPNIYQYPHEPDEHER